jgi:hypothetical protein
MTPSTFMRHHALAGVTAGLALLLAACGGGGDAAGDTATTTVITEVPASATVSVEAYSDFATALAAQSGERTEPIDLAMAVPPTSETADPVELR